jgi:hypothetical protein
VCGGEVAAARGKKGEVKERGLREEGGAIHHALSELAPMGYRIRSLSLFSNQYLGQIHFRAIKPICRPMWQVFFAEIVGWIRKEQTAFFNDWDGSIVLCADEIYS